MKRQVRNSVFETNSSSMHSLVIKKSDGYYTEDELREDLYLDRNNAWEIWSDEYIRFGRAPFGCLGTFESKVRYAIASLCGYRADAAIVFEEIESLVREIIPECTYIKLPKNNWSNKTSYGCVDEDILTGFLEEEHISLKEFLTNKKYVVIVDGDEYCIWNSLKESGLVNVNDIEKEYG